MAMIRTTALALTMVLGLGGPAFAQTSDDLFNPEVMQRIELWLNSSDWQKLKATFQENTYYPADLTWNGQTVPNVGIRSRGLGSRRSEKPGLRVDFDYFSSKQQFLGLKSFVLDNLSQDATGVKESVTMRFYARLGIPAPRETFARLFVNGEYAGLYGLVESVDKTMMGRVFGSIGDDVQNDGYLFEYNYVMGSPWRFTYEGPALTPYKLRFDIKTNETHAESKIWGPIEELVRLTNESSSGSFESAIADRLDLPAFVRYLAAQNFVADFDGFNGYEGMNNFYLYRLENSSKHVFIAWDEDNAFLQPDYPILTRIDENVLTSKLLSLSAYRTQYFNVMLEAADSATSWLKQEMRRQLDLIQEAMLADPAELYSDSEHLAAREALLNFPEARITYVRCEVARGNESPLPASCR
jgi:spore coat protein CotH